MTGMQIRKQLTDKLQADISETEKKLKLLKLMKKKYENITSEQIIVCHDIFNYLNASEITIYKDE